MTKRALTLFLIGLLLTLGAAPLIAEVAAKGKPDQVIVIQGRREPSEAINTSQGFRYLPFMVPEGVTKISIKKELDWGPDPKDRGTAQSLLCDSRGFAFNNAGFRGWESRQADEYVITGDRATTSRYFIAGPLTPGRWTLGQWFRKSSKAGLNYKYTITFSFDGPKPPKQIPTGASYNPGVINSNPGWYPGDLHLHSTNSDGAATLPERVALHKSGGYKFMVSTDHNDCCAHAEFPTAAQPDILMMFGEEVTTQTGHANVIGARPGEWYDFRIGGGDGLLPQVINKAHRDGALFSVNHPIGTYAWRYPESEWASADSIEVQNGRWTIDDRKATDMWDQALKSGRRIRAVSGSDVHANRMVNGPACWVYAQNLSKDAIMEGLRKGHIMITATTASAPTLMLSIEGEKVLPGDTIKRTEGSNLPVQVHVTGGKGATLRLVWASSEVRLPVTEDDATLRYSVPVVTGKGFAYVRAELEQPDATVTALTNPIYVETR